MSGERCLYTLGLKMGCSSEDVKKAYKTKALQYHPDRNPGSTTASESFKLVHQAYEFLTKNPTALTTPSYSVPSNNSGRGYQESTSTGGVYSKKPSTPLCSEEELFGGMSDFGDFGRKKKSTSGSDKAAGAQRTRSFTNGFRQAQSTQQQDENSAPHPPPRHAQSFKDGEFEGDSKEKIFADRAKAEEGTSEGKGGKVPLSAYTPSDVANEAHARHEVLEKLRKSNEFYRTGNLPPKADRSWDGSRAKTREFHEAREEAQAKMDAAASMERMDREERKKKIDQETKAEWDAYMSKMEDESIKRNVQAAMKRAERASQEESKADKLLREVSADRRKMKAEEYSRGMPSTTAIGTMSEGDLNMLVGILGERLQFAQQCLKHKSSGACALCHTSKRAATANQEFNCSHRATCELCFETAVECPVCGAEKK